MLLTSVYETRARFFEVLPSRKYAIREVTSDFTAWQVQRQAAHYYSSTDPGGEVGKQQITSRCNVTQPCANECLQTTEFAFIRAPPQNEQQNADLLNNICNFQKYKCLPRCNESKPCDEKQDLHYLKNLPGWSKQETRANQFRVCTNSFICLSSRTHAAADSPYSSNRPERCFR